jgi:hypothetical protein
MRKQEALMYRRLVHELFFSSSSRVARSSNSLAGLVSSFIAGRSGGNRILPTTDAAG